MTTLLAISVACESHPPAPFPIPGLQETGGKFRIGDTYFFTVEHPGNRADDLIEAARKSVCRDWSNTEVFGRITGIEFTEIEEFSKERPEHGPVFEEPELSFY